MAEIELTAEQRQTLQAVQGKPIDVVDPTTQQRYVLLERERYERLHAPLERGQAQNPPPSVPPVALCSEEGQPRRVRLGDLPTPPEVSTDAERWCKRHGWWGKKRRREVEEQLKLQFYYGGQAIYLLDTSEGPIIVPIPERYKDTPDLRYVLFSAEERPNACLTVPSRWQDADSEILS